MASAADAVVELDIQAAHDEDNGLRESFQHDFSLPQADGGRQAYLFLAGAFAVETLIWGKISSHHPEPIQHHQV